MKTKGKNAALFGFALSVRGDRVRVSTSDRAAGEAGCQERHVALRRSGAAPEDTSGKG